MGRIVDLSSEIRSGMLKHPIDPEVEIKTKVAKFEKIFELCYDGGGNTCGVGSTLINCEPGRRKISFMSHTGTHIDAPSYIDPEREAIDDYPISKFDNTAVILDFTPLKIIERKYKGVSIGDLRNVLTPDLEEKCKKVGALILYTGYCNDLVAYDGKVWGENKKKFEESSTYLLPDAAYYIADRICSDKLNILGIDSFCVDRKEDEGAMSHYWLFEKNILPLEGLVNLNELSFYAKNKLFRLISVPLKYKEGDAAQTRAYAVVD